VNKKVAIIGGGASGLMCAIFCAKHSLDVTLFEQNSRLGKKILVSGNGRCNITNTQFSKENYYSQNPDFVTHALKEFDFISFEKFINSLGLLLDKKEDGRCYPMSQEAKSVAYLLEEYARALGVKIFLEKKIQNPKELFEEFSHVVIATGSQAAPHLGGNADAQEFALAFGHSLQPCYPSLVQLEINSTTLHKMAGAKLDAEVTLLINNSEIKSVKGDLLFTKYGLSGLTILDLSAEASKALLNYERVTLSLNLLPNFSAQALSSHISLMAKNQPTLKIFDILLGLLAQKIVLGVLESLDISPSLPSNAIHTKMAKCIAHRLLQWRFDVDDTHGFRHAEVSGGGVCTDEIDAKTMESKRVKNLYFIGESLDVVGERGGYNFAWAWASGVSAAKSISKE